MVSLKTAVRTRRIKSIALRLVAFCVVALVFGFSLFTWLLPRKPVVLEGNADGIVVLTGGTSRVTDGLELLAAGRAKRLLITGVNPGTSTGAIAHEFPKYDAILNCCVDLDYSALNTRGNARQARLWAKTHDFHSLIVVTSAYHMPRALAELAHQLPRTTLMPFPVITERLPIDRWWLSSEATKLVLSEYIKYLFAEVRMRFDTVAPDNKDNRVSDTRRL